MALNKNLERYFNELESKFNLPNGTLKSVASIESNFNPNAKAKGSSAKGMFQFTDATAKDYGLTNPFDPYASADAAAKYISNNAKRYGGDIGKAVLAYHAGPGEVDKHGTNTNNMSKYVNRNYLREFNNRFKKFSGKSENENNEINSSSNEVYANNSSDYTPYNPENDNVDNILNEFKISNNSGGFNQESTISDHTLTQTAGATGSYSPDNPAQTNQDPNIVSTDNPADAQKQDDGSLDDIYKEFGISNPSFQSQQPSQAPSQEIPQTQQPGVQQPTQQSFDEKDQQIFDKFINHPQPLTYYGSLTPAQQGVLDNSLRKYLQANPDQAEKIAGNHSKFQNFAVGAVTGINTGVQTGKQLLGKIFGNQQWQDEANQSLKNYDNYSHIQDVINPNNAGGYTTAGKIGGEVLGGLLLPAAKVAQLGRYGNLALNSGIAGGLFTGTTSEGDNYWKDKAIQAGTAAVAAPIASKAIESVANPIANFVGRTFSKTPASTQAEINAMQREGYNYYAGDLSDTTNPKVLNYLARTDDEINTALKANADTALSNIDNFKNSLGRNADTDAYVNKYANVLSASQDASHAYNETANKAIQKLQNASNENPDELLKAMANIQWLEKKLVNEGNYNAVGNLAPTGQTSQASKYSEFLTNLKNRVDNSAFPDDEAEIVYNYLSKGKFDPSSMNINNYDSAIRMLGDRARNAKAQGNLTESNQFNEAKNALMADKNTHLSQVTGDADYANAYNKAQNYYRENIVPVNKDKNLSNVFNMVDKNGKEIPPDNLINKWIKSGDTSKVKDLFKQLDTESQTVFKNAAFNRIYNESLDKNNELSIDAFKKAYNKFASKTSDGRSVNTLDAVFSGPEKQNFANLIKGLNSFRTYASSKNDPQTAALIYDKLTKYFPALSAGAGVALSAGTGGVVPLVLGTVTGGTGYLLRQSYIKAAQDPKMAKYFLKLSKVSPGTKEFVDALDKIIERGAPAPVADALVGDPANPQNSGLINSYLGASGQNPQNNISSNNDKVDYFSQDLKNNVRPGSYQGIDYFEQDRKNMR